MSPRGLIVWLPNLISLARLFAVPVTVYLLLLGQFGAAFWLFVAAGLSDALDGIIAKQFDARSEVGAYLDPLADKALLMSIYVTLGYLDYVAMWLVILIVFRDLLIIGGALAFHTLTQSLTMEPLFISKANTTAQIVLACVVLAQLAWEYTLPGVNLGLVVLVAATTVLSGGVYVVKWSRKAVSMERDS